MTDAQCYLLDAAGLQEAQLVGDERLASDLDQ
jgi:hypothetical protein